MENAEVRIVSNEREIASEPEKAYPLKSETMKQRLLAAKERQEGLSVEAVVEKLRI